MKAIKTYVEKAYEIIKERNLSYSPELFSAIIKEVKSNENNQQEEKVRVSQMNRIDNGYRSRMTAYGMNPRPY